MVIESETYTIVNIDNYGSSAGANNVYWPIFHFVVLSIDLCLFLLKLIDINMYCKCILRR